MCVKFDSPGVSQQTQERWGGVNRKRSCFLLFSVATLSLGGCPKIFVDHIRLPPQAAPLTASVPPVMATGGGGEDVVLNLVAIRGLFQAGEWQPPPQIRKQMLLCGAFTVWTLLLQMDLAIRLSFSQVSTPLPPACTAAAAPPPRGR